MGSSAGAHRFRSQGEAIMPIGTRYVRVGILRTTLLGHVLEVEDGEWWQLDIAGPTDAYAGRRIVAAGIRTGAQRLMVEQLTVDEDDPPATVAPPQGPVAAVVQAMRRMWRWWP